MKRSTRLLALGLLGVYGSLAPTPAQAQKKKAAAAEAPVAAPGGSAIFERAQKLYDSKDYESASIELFKVIEGDSGDAEPVKQKAEFLMGKTLYHMKFYSASLTYFDRVVQKGAAHAHYNETLRWLASLSRDLGDAGGVLEKIGKYNKAELEAPQLDSVRDELYFLLGKFNYSKGKLKEAVELFNLVPRKSLYYVQAKLFEGATHVRENKGQPAAEAFKEVLRAAAETDDPKVKPYEDLANLSLARTFYSTGQYELATKYFDRVSTDSYDWANSLFESSWANFMLQAKGFSKALGNIQTLQAPYFQNVIKPESVAEALTVKATIYYYNCLYDRVENAIADFRERFEPLAIEIKRLVDGTTDNTAFFELAQKIRDGKSDLNDTVENAARAVLSDRSLARRFDFVRNLDRELTQHDKLDPAWKSTQVANAVYAEITLQRSLTVNEAGELSRQRVNRLLGELAVLIKRVLKIEAEMLAGAKSQLEAEVETERQISSKGRARDLSNIPVDDEHEFWPFTGEWWRDELGYYRVRLLNKCEKNAPEGAPSPGPEAPAAAPTAAVP
jgi:predicted negative regulator of RcsB-dependent stress response